MEDKFLWWEAESYSFIKLPKILLESPKYATLSGEAKILYGLLLMTDTVCGNAPTVRIGGNDIPREAVRSRLFKLEAEHIEYVLDRLNENTSKVHNPKSYMLTALYNAPTSMDFYYTAEVNHDLYGS